jgi:hypothetical protein
VPDSVANGAQPEVVVVPPTIVLDGHKLPFAPLPAVESAFQFALGEGVEASARVLMEPAQLAVGGRGHAFGDLAVLDTQQRVLGQRPVAAARRRLQPDEFRVRLVQRARLPACVQLEQSSPADADDACLRRQG